jgi:hypothetical protein
VVQRWATILYKFHAAFGRQAKVIHAITTKPGSDSMTIAAFSLFLFLKKDYLVLLKHYDNFFLTCTFLPCTRNTLAHKTTQIPTETLPALKDIGSFSSLLNLLEKATHHSPVFPGE